MNDATQGPRTESADAAPGASWAFEPLTPTAFLVRSALVHGRRLAVVDGDRRLTYGALYERCRRAAGGVAALARGRTVAVLAPNSLALLEAHFAVPWAAAPLLTLNTRLAPSELSWIVRHAGAAVLLFDHELEGVAREVLADAPGVQGIRVGGPRGPDEYEELVAGGDPTALVPADERQLLSVNYTSGTTGSPKGVMYHHRGAYLQALAMVVHARLSASDVFLWTLPMFHCNGWCLPWAVTAAGAVHVCVRRVTGAEMWHAIREHGITALAGAPTVLSILGYAEAATALGPGRRLQVLTGGAPPTPAVIARMRELGATVTHLYGLTETFGPLAICDWQPEWDDLSRGDQAVLQARQGVANLIASPLRVIDATGEDVPADGATSGEVAVRGNDVMLGYLHDEAATRAAIPDGWFRTGDVAVMHPDGYIELRDRAKDIIITGGENVSSVEVERVLSEHPAVLECAVIAVPDERWGEAPAAYVTLHEHTPVTAEELLAFARSKMAHFKVPRSVVFGELPKTSTGKVQKAVLREAAWAGRDRRIG
jgi:fatty-acyl-CoA synthase